MLSLVLSGKSRLSAPRRKKVAIALGLHPDAFQNGGPTKKKPIVDQPMRDVSLDYFFVLSEWYHFAILSLLDTPGSVFEAKWISKRLGISIMEAKLAIERLKSLDLIEKTDGRWKQKGGPIRVNESEANSASRKFQKDLLLKAIQSLEKDPQPSRDISSMTFCMNPERVTYAAERIAQFRRELSRELETEHHVTEVYQLTIQLFPLSKKELT